MTSPRRRWLLNGLLAAALVVALVAGALLVLRPADAASTTNATTRTVAVTTGSVQATVTADGTVQAVSQVAANFETSGTVATLLVAVGDTVRKGETIAMLDRTSAKRQLALARANLASAEASLSAAEDGTTTTDPQTGASTTTVSDSQVLQAESQVLQAQASVDDAATALAATIMRAPIAGTVLEVNGRVGSSSVAGGTGAAGDTTSSDFVVVADLSKLEVAVSFSEADVANLAVRQAATVTFPALADVTAKGAITAIDPTGTASNSVVTFGAVVRLATVPKSLRLGQSASVSITTGSVTDVVVVPSATVTTNGSGSTVTTLAADGSRRTTRIEVGLVGDSFTEVTSGLAVGDQVLLTTATSGGSTNFPAFPGGAVPGGIGGGAVGGPPGGIRPGG